LQCWDIDIRRAEVKWLIGSAVMVVLGSLINRMFYWNGPTIFGDFIPFLGGYYLSMADIIQYFGFGLSISWLLDASLQSYFAELSYLNKE
jgi:hypothetical protein